MTSWKPPPGKSGNRPAGFVVGRAAFERISAIEGIQASAGSRARSTEFDRLGLSAEERRRAIIKAHRPET